MVLKMANTNASERMQINASGSHSRLIGFLTMPRNWLWLGVATHKTTPAMEIRIVAIIP